MEKLDLIPANGLLGRQSREVDPWPSMHEYLIETEEVVESAVALPRSLPINSLNEILNVTG
jgi:hypothetical protein